MRYFFDLSDATGETIDTEGTVLGTFEGMRLEAKRILACVAADEPYPTDTLTVSLRVRNEHNEYIYDICLLIKGSSSPLSVD